MKYITTAMLIALAAGCGEELDMNQTFSQGHSVANPSTPAPEKPEQSQDAVRQIPVIEETEEITVADEVIEISPNEITEVFLTEKMEQAIDLMWVLDNSNSMGDEHAKILANFSSFMSEVSGRSKLKMGVISSKGKWGIDLTSYGVEQVDATTGSMTALSLAAASLCDASRSDSNGSGFAKSSMR